MKDFLYNNFLEIIAILVSVSTLIWTWINSKKVTRKTLNKEFFEKIYFDYIIIKLPECLFKFESMNNNATVECDEMKELVLEILDKSIFYKYFDNKFYEKIKKIIIKIEDVLMQAASETNSTVFREHKEKIISLNEDLYKAFKEYYSEI